MLSPTMQAAVDLLREGPLVRWPGGFWAHEEEPYVVRERPNDHGWPAYKLPARYTEIRTLRALEKRGLVVCDGHMARLL